jgi:oligosaccharide repeat unit polymerase
VAFAITLLYSIGGIIYYPSLYSFVAFLYILTISLPLLIVGLKEKKEILNIKPLNNFLFLIMIIFGIHNLKIIANNSGYNFVDIFSITGIAKIATQSTLIRYEIDPTANSGNPILLAFSLWLIFRTSISTNSTKLKILLSFLPIIFYTILTTEKWPTFLAIVFYLTGIFLSHDYCFKEIFTFIKAKIKYVMLIIFTMVYSLILRGDNESVFILLHKLFHYVFASYYGLGYWLVEKYTLTDLTFGKLSFIGPLSFIGLENRDAGVFAIRYYIYDMESNIYTAFRYIIEDFSLVGPFIINIFLIILYYWTKKHKLYKIALSVKLFIIYSSLLSLNVTPFVHNSVFFAIVLSIMTIAFPNIKFRSKRKFNE